MHPPPHPKPDLSTQSQGHTGQDDNLEACPPASTIERGVSRFEPKKPSSSPKRREDEIRFSPVYAGHLIKPLKKLTLLRGRLQSRTGSRSSGTPDNPCRTPAKTTLPPSFRTIQADFLKGMISCRIGLRNTSTNAPASASTSGGLLSSREHPACQEQNSHQFGKPDLPTETGSIPLESADRHGIRQWLAPERREEIDHRAARYHQGRLKSMAADKARQRQSDPPST